MAYFINNNFEVATKKPIDNRMAIGTSDSDGIYDFATTTALYNAHVAEQITLFDGLMVTDADTHIMYECVFVDGAPTFVNRSFGVNMLVFKDGTWRNEVASSLTIEPNEEIVFKAVTFGNVTKVEWSLGTNYVCDSIYNPDISVTWSDSVSGTKQVRVKVYDVYGNYVQSPVFTILVSIPTSTLMPVYYGLSDNNLLTQEALDADIIDTTQTASEYLDPNLSEITIPYYTNLVSDGANSSNVFIWAAFPVNNPTYPIYINFKDSDAESWILISNDFNIDFFTIEDTIYRVYKFKGSYNSEGVLLGLGNVGGNFVFKNN